MNNNRALTLNTVAHNGFNQVEPDGGSAHTPSASDARRDIHLHPELVYLNDTTAKPEVLKREQYLTGYSRIEGDEELYSDNEDWNPFDKSKPIGKPYITGSNFVQGEICKLLEEYRTYLVLLLPINQL